MSNFTITKKTNRVQHYRRKGYKEKLVTSSPKGRKAEKNMINRKYKDFRFVITTNLLKSRMSNSMNIKERCRK
jgi:hypothetical protein